MVLTREYCFLVEKVEVSLVAATPPDDGAVGVVDLIQCILFRNLVLAHGVSSWQWKDVIASSGKQRKLASVPVPKFICAALLHL